MEVAYLSGRRYRAQDDGLIAMTYAERSPHVDGLIQERRKFIDNALELRISCTNPTMEWNYPMPIFHRQACT